MINKDLGQLTFVCGIVDNKIIGPYFIEGTFNSDKYKRFLMEMLLTLLEDVSLDVR